jgi:hypothetical protein
MAIWSQRENMTSCHEITKCQFCSQLQGVRQSILGGLAAHKYIYSTFWECERCCDISQALMQWSNCFPKLILLVTYMKDIFLIKHLCTTISLHIPLSLQIVFVPCLAPCHASGPLVCLYPFLNNLNLVF